MKRIERSERTLTDKFESRAGHSSRLTHAFSADALSTPLHSMSSIDFGQSFPNSRDSARSASNFPPV
jgi:hypothetical protein